MSRTSWQLTGPYVPERVAPWLLGMAALSLALDAYEAWAQHEAAERYAPVSSDLCLGLCDGHVARWSRAECWCATGTADRVNGSTGVSAGEDGSTEPPTPGRAVPGQKKGMSGGGQW